MRKLAYIVFVCATATLVYASGLEGPFIYDDAAHIEGNPGIRDLTDLDAVLHGGFQETRPVYLLSLALNYRFAGYDVLHYHLFNLGLHLACVLLLYGLTLALCRDLRATLPLDRGEASVPRWFPELAALAFAVHPLCTEAVTYTNSRSGLLSACFGLASVLAYLSYLDTAGRKRWMTYGASLAAFLLALGSKESGVVFPVLLLLYLLLFRAPFRRRQGRSTLLPLVGFVPCLALVPYLFLTVTNPHTGTIGWDVVPLTHHWMTQVRVLAFFVYLAVLPLQHNLDYDFPVSTSLLDGELLASGALLVLLIVLALRMRKRFPVIAFAILWFFAALAPTNSVIPFVDFIAERHMYTALMGAGVLLGFLGARLLAAGARRGTRSRIITACLVAAVIIGFGVLSARRNAVLADPFELWRQTVAQSPNKVRPNLAMAYHLFTEKRYDEGRRYLERAASIDPDHHEVNYNLGVYYEHTGQTRLARDYFRRAFEARPLVSYAKSLARVEKRLGADPRP